MEMPASSGAADAFLTGEMMNEELAKFTSKLEQFQTKVDERCTEFSEAMASQHQQFLSSAEKKLGQLEKLHQQEQERRQQRSVLDKLRAELDAATQQRSALLHQKELMETDLHHAVAELTQERELLELQQKGVEEMKGKLEETAKLFHEYLALEFRKTSGDRLQFIFRRINPKEVDQPFYFFVKILEDRKYEVTDCQPPLPDLPLLVEKLNSTNNFQSFVLAVRRRFKASVQQ